MYLNYQKRKNVELFKGLEQSNTLFLSHTQNYIPIYNKFFSLNETNYNNVNLNHNWYISSISERNSEQASFPCKIKSTATEKTKQKEIFFKLAPLLDPYKYLIGKYTQEDSLFNLPAFGEQSISVNSKLLDTNNSAYVDGFFVYLTSCLNEHSNFLHGINYYGSFLSIKNNYEINISDDLDYLTNSDFFIKNKGTLFQVQDYEHLYNKENIKKKPIKISSLNSVVSLGPVENITHDFEQLLDSPEEITLIDLTNVNLFELEENRNMKSTTIRTSSTCSSRTSHTLSNLDEEDLLEDNNETTEERKMGDDSSAGSDSWEDEEENDINSEECDEDIIATLPKFPVQVICMEHCEDTFDNLILHNDLSAEEWLSALMQIIMTLITYQKVYSFTHNDLHTNNVMYVTTTQKFIYYRFNEVVYKVPTFGRLFKIIDFGRSIYKFKGNIFCSDSFQIGNDAATQYNTEPYFNDKKPRLEPNYSFDLCRLGCSIFDYLVPDLSELKNMKSCKDPVKKIIVEWCLDDTGVNLLYKNNGDDRYPEFKLYKMISRFVHNHTPQAQLERPEFKQFSSFKGDMPNENTIINIDKYCSCV